MSEDTIESIILVTCLIGGMIMAFIATGPKSIAGAILVVGVIYYDNHGKRK